MPKGHGFNISTREWPTDRPATRADLTITRPSGEAFTFQLGPGDFRRLVRAALTGLGYTKIVRPWHGKQVGWEQRVEANVLPIMKVVETYFPKDKAKVGSQLTT